MRKQYQYRAWGKVLAVAALLCTVFVSGRISPAQAQSTERYRNLVNERFATVGSGPQSSLVVDVPSGATDTALRQRVGAIANRDFEAKMRALAPQLIRAEARGVIKRGAVLPLSSVVQIRKQGRLVPAPRIKTRAVGGGTLTFRYVGFNSTDTELLRRFADVAYPRLVAVYGQPAWSGEVVVENAGDLFSSTIPETRRFARGVYLPAEGRILLPIFNDPRGALEAYLLTMTHAFHGPATMEFDAWEQGFARAAASVVLRDPVFAAQFGMDDGSAQSLFSLLPYYDILNQPPLANATFFPPSQQNIPIDGQITVAKMLWARIGMAGAAWLKVYIENQNFFRDFNASYYAAFDPAASPSLAANVPALRAIATPLLPSGVEGKAWDEWFVQQYILDSSVTSGVKLFAFVLPAPRDVNGRQSSATTVVYYRTEKSGDEILLNGQAYATYLDAENARLQLGPQTEQATISNGEGGLTINTQNAVGVDATRLTISFSVGSTTARTYLPAGFDGDFQGVVLGSALTRGVNVSQTTLPPVQTRTADAAYQGKAFGATLASANNELGVTVVRVSDGAATRDYRINTGDGLYYAVIREAGRGGGARSISKTFDTGPVPYLISPPVRPFQPDIANALSLPPTDFLLSAWNPLRGGGPGYDTFAPGQRSVEAIQPGKAYWLKLAPRSNAAQVTVTLNGAPPPADTSFTVGLSYGWNLVGSPFDEPIPLSDVKVQQLQQDAFSWDEAVERNLVAAKPYAFDRATGQYREVDGFGGEWEGYWVRVLAPSGVTIYLPGPDVPAASRSVGRATRALVPLRPQWAVRLTAHQQITPLRGVGSDFGTRATVVLGAGSGATRGFDNRFDRELPPPPIPVVSAEFAPVGTNGAAITTGGRYVSDIRDIASASRGAWEMRVTAPESGRVTLTWDGLNSVPRTTRFTLTDTKSGRTLALGSRSSYDFDAQAGETRVFRVQSEAARSMPLVITNVSTMGGAATRGVGGGVSIVYTLTGAADDVQITVAALNGNVVHRASRGRAEAGVVRAHFNGRSQDGAPIPPGPYTLTITARGANGETAQTKRVLMLLQ